MSNEQRAELAEAWAYIAQMRAVLLHLRLLVAEIEELEGRAARLSHGRPATVLARLH
jgi:hypothetical protein